MQRVAFICVHNACRSQMAEALGRHLASDVFESCSAGTERKDRINPDAVRLMKARYGIDMEETARKRLEMTDAAELAELKEAILQRGVVIEQEVQIPSV